MTIDVSKHHITSPSDPFVVLFVYFHILAGRVPLFDSLFHHGIAVHSNYPPMLSICLQGKMFLIFLVFCFCFSSSSFCTLCVCVFRCHGDPCLFALENNKLQKLTIHTRQPPHRNALWKQTMTSIHEIHSPSQTSSPNPIPLCSAVLFLRVCVCVSASLRQNFFFHGI